jgi:pyruvate,water dikinase
VSSPESAAPARPLSDLRRADEPLFGGKSAGLGELLAAGIRVPPGFALSCAAFDHFIDEAALHETIASGDSAAIMAAIRAAEVPAEVRCEVARHYAALGAETGDEPPVAVRSSAVGEDSAEATFAGQQETLLWVRGADAVCAAVRECWASLYSPTAISYRAQLGDRARRPAMGVAVQLMVDAAVAGVLFTCNPMSGDPSMVAINASWGFGEAVVGGEVTPDDYLISKVTREVVRERVSSKEIEYVAAQGGQGTVKVEVPGDRREVACLDGGALEALVDIARAAERHFGCHQDVEWAIARAGAPPDNVFVVQSRPVTAVAQRPREAPAASAISLVMGTFGVGRRGG